MTATELRDKTVAAMEDMVRRKRERDEKKVKVFEAFKAYLGTGRRPSRQVLVNPTPNFFKTNVATS